MAEYLHKGGARRPIVEITPIQAIRIVLDDMMASGSWHAPTMRRVIENVVPLLDAASAERIPAHFDIIAAITTTRKTYEAGISVRAAITSGGETEPLRAELLARFKEQATAFGYLVEPIDDDAARGESEAEAARPAAHASTSPGPVNCQQRLIAAAWRYLMPLNLPPDVATFLAKQEAAERPKLNIYTCDNCGGHIVTKDVDIGVTPFMLGCKATEGCKGMMKSSMYRVFDQAMRPSHEWYRPDSADGLSDWETEHVMNGGLLIREATHAA